MLTRSTPMGSAELYSMCRLEYYYSRTLPGQTRPPRPCIFRVGRSPLSSGCCSAIQSMASRSCARWPASTRPSCELPSSRVIFLLSSLQALAVSLLAHIALPCRYRCSLSLCFPLVWVRYPYLALLPYEIPFIYPNFSLPHHADPSFFSGYVSMSLFYPFLHFLFLLAPLRCRRPLGVLGCRCRRIGPRTAASSAPHGA